MEDILKGGASASGDLDLFISYEVLDDAVGGLKIMAGNGGIIGPTNKTSFAIKLQPQHLLKFYNTTTGTRFLDMLVVAGGGAGGTNASGNVGSAEVELVAYVNLIVSVW